MDTLDIALLIKIAIIGIAYVLLQYAVELISYYNTYWRAYHDTADKRITYIQKLRRQNLGFFSSKESGELIMLKGGYQSKVRPAVPHVLMWCMNAMGSTLNLFLFRASYVKIYMDLGMDEATATAAVNQAAEFWCAPQNILISLCVTAILCVGGYLLGVKMLGKHFKPAGVA